MKALILAWVLSNSADLATTELAIHSGKGREVGLLRKTEVRVPYKLTLTVGGVYAVKKGYKKHPKLTTVLVVAASGLYTAASVHNYRVYRSSR